MKQLGMWKYSLRAVLIVVTLLASTMAQTEANGAQHDAVKIHGHWTIVIKNADGSVASRHEFENALFQGDGDRLLAGILGRTMATGNWIIGLDAPSASTARPCNSGGAPAPCQIAEPNGSALSGEELFANLTIQVTGATKNQLTLSGSAKSTNGGQLGQVSTYAGACQSSVAPSSCGAFGSSIHQFTAHSVSPVIAVQAGQSINVTVVISFS